MQDICSNTSIAMPGILVYCSYVKTCSAFWLFSPCLSLLKSSTWSHHVNLSNHQFIGYGFCWNHTATNPAELSNRHSQHQLGQKIHLFLPVSIFSDHLRDQPIQEDELLRAICCIPWPIEIKETSSIRIQFVCETDLVSQFLIDQEWVQEVGCVELG